METAKYLRAAFILIPNLNNPSANITLNSPAAYQKKKNKFRISMDDVTKPFD